MTIVKRGAFKKKLKGPKEAVIRAFAKLELRRSSGQDF